MSLLTLGLNHTTAPIDVRERVVFEPAGLGKALTGLTGIPGVQEAAIVSTCNRTEIYCALDSPAAGNGVITDWFHDWHRLAPDAMARCLYRYEDTQVIRHLMRVASGLDSMVLGEPQIAGQLKDAYRAAVAHEAVGPELGKLFQHVFAVAKEVRTDTAIGTSPVSVAFAATTLAKQIFGDLRQAHALMIGAGETIHLATRHLHSAGIRQITIANRDAQRAIRLAEPFGGQGIGLAQIPDVLHQADIIVSSTASTLPILGKGAVEHALKRRRRKPMFMVDIAVPRDIESAIGELNDVFLYTVDDLRGVIEENMAARRAAADEAEAIIESRVEEFLAWQRSLGAVDTIKEYRAQADAVRARTLEQARRMLERDGDAEDALAFLAHTLTTRLLHEPTVTLRHAGRDERTELIDAARELFNLDGKRK